ncbi:MAG TPA: hypothetical protein VM487_25165 [Phycisphaerae bacterium]|nr:hypothetical protein [Phycisphaerae bacterium]
MLAAAAATWPLAAPAQDATQPQAEPKAAEPAEEAAPEPAEADRQLSALYKKYWRTSVKDAIADATKQVKLRKAQQKAGTTADAADQPVAPSAEGAAEDGQASDQNPDDMARMWLIIGNIHRLNGRSAEAADAYRKLVYEYPDSRFTQEARNKLGELEAESAAEPGGDAQ